MKAQILKSVLSLGILGVASCAPTSVCSDTAAIPESAFVIATTPTAGSSVQSGFAVAGCSRTFESNVNWKLTGRSGNVLASGNTSGGGVDGPAGFAFNVSYSISQSEIGHLEVYEEDASDGEGFPPGKTVIPLVLQP